MIIDIKMVVDTGMLRQHYPHPSQDTIEPTAIAQKDAFMVAAPLQSVHRGHGSDSLELNAGTEDVLRWRVSTTAIDMRYVMLYKVILLDEKGAVPVNAGNQGLKTKPTGVLTSRLYPVPDITDPTHYTESQRLSVCWELPIKKYGKHHFQLLFYIVEQNAVDGKLKTVGYYSWEPRKIHLMKHW
ncbi:MAG: hypothetical protein HGA99_07490 [Chlorobiaceae bacterium]|nr:hypothetical protein [Chlorobiaceae bacterium]